MERRNFIKNSALLGGGLLAFNNLSGLQTGSQGAKEMTYATLGRTGEKVSRLGLGGGPVGWSDDPEEVINMISKAFDEGITFFDTAPTYTDGKSEERFGKALKGKRDKVFLVSKTADASYEGTWKLLNQSLKRLQTDYIDLVHIHNIGHERTFPDLNYTLSDDGALGALREAKQKGAIRFIGASGHVYPSRFHQAMDTNEIDVLMLAVNFILQHTYDFEHKVWARALTKNLGLVSMKVLGGSDGRNNRNHRMDPEDYENAIRYTLTLNGLSTAVIGVGNIEEYNKLYNTFVNATPLSEDEFLKLSKHGLEIIEKNPWWKTPHGTPVT